MIKSRVFFTFFQQPIVCFFLQPERDLFHAARCARPKRVETRVSHDPYGLSKAGRLKPLSLAEPLANGGVSNFRCCVAGRAPVTVIIVAQRVYWLAGRSRLKRILSMVTELSNFASVVVLTLKAGDEKVAPNRGARGSVFSPWPLGS